MYTFMYSQYPLSYPPYQPNYQSQYSYSFSQYPLNYPYPPRYPYPPHPAMMQCPPVEKGQRAPGNSSWQGQSKIAGSMTLPRSASPGPSGALNFQSTRRSDVVTQLYKGVPSLSTSRRTPWGHSNGTQPRRLTGN